MDAEYIEDDNHPIEESDDNQEQASFGDDHAGGEEAPAGDEGVAYESSEESTPEPESQAAEPVKSPRKTIYEKLAEERREKYRAQNEMQRMAAEIDRLQKLADSSTKTALSHYEDAATQRLEMAKERKIRAYEMGDIHEQTDADIALMKATNEWQNLNNLKAREEVLKQSHYQPQQPQMSHAEKQMHDQQQYELQRWVQHNPWFHPESQNYDPELADAVQDYCAQFENNLIKGNSAHLIGSSEYFDVVNKYVDTLNRERQQPQQYKKDLTMSKPLNPVGAVRQGGVPGRATASANQVRLTPQEREMAKLINMPEKEYLQYVLGERQKQMIKQGGR